MADDPFDEARSPETRMEQDAEMRADAIEHGYARFGADNPPAVDREALEKVILGMYGTQPEQRPMPSALADAILSSGAVQDADEVRREGLTNSIEASNQAFIGGRVTGRRECRAELQAAIEALADKPHVIHVQTIEGVELAPVIWPDELRALVADGGDALREVKAQARRELLSALAEHIGAYRWYNVPLARLDGPNGPPTEDVVAVPDLEEFIESHGGEAGDDA